MRLVQPRSIVVGGHCYQNLHHHILRELPVHTHRRRRARVFARPLLVNVGGSLGCYVNVGGSVGCYKDTTRKDTRRGLLRRTDREGANSQVGIVTVGDTEGVTRNLSLE